MCFQRRLPVSAPTLNVQVGSYDDDFEGGGRYSRGPRPRQGGNDQQRRQQRGGRSRSYDEGDDEVWGGASEFNEEVVNIDGSEPSTASSTGYQEQRSGRGYGRGGGGSSYRGGQGGGRGSGRYSGDRRWGGAYDNNNNTDEAGGAPGGFGEQGQGQQGGQQGWQGRRYGEGGGRGYQGQGRRGGGYAGGRGRGSYSNSNSYGDEGNMGQGGEERRPQRGYREALSPEAMAARLANNDAVKAANDWRAIAAVLETRGSSLDAENIAFMLFKVAKEGRPASPESAAEFETLVASLYGWVSALAPTMRTKPVAQSLYAVAKLELFNADLVAALASRAVQMMGNFTAWDYSNMLWAFSRMNFTPGDEWLAQYVFWTERRLGDFKALELSNTIAAMSRLGYAPTPAWLDAFAKAAATQAPYLNILEATNLLFGLASLGYQGGSDPSSWLDPLLTAGKVAGSQAGSADGSDGRGGAITNMSGYTMETMRVSELTRITWALTQFNWQPPAAWLEGACRSFTRQLRYCRPSDLATISYSLAYLRVTPTAEDLRRMADLLSRSWRNLSGDELANVAMSLALWQYRPATDRWLDELVIAVRDKMPSCSADGLSKVVSALPMLGSGYRLSQVVSHAQSLLDNAAAQQATGTEESAEAVPYASPDAAMAAA